MSIKFCNLLSIKLLQIKINSKYDKCRITRALADMQTANVKSKASQENLFYPKDQYTSI